jgi:hypothetical protein
VADRRDRLPRIRELPDHGHDPAPPSERIGILGAAREQQRVEILGVDIADLRIRHRGGAIVALDLLLLQRSQRHLGAALTKHLQRLQQFGILKPIGGDHQDLRFGNRRHVALHFQ